MKRAKRKMNLNRYDELEKKYKALLEENKCLKAKIQEIETNSEFIIPQKGTVQTRESLFPEPEEPISNQKSGEADLDGNFSNDKPVKIGRAHV